MAVDYSRQQKGETDTEYAERMARIRRSTMTPEQRRAEHELEQQITLAQRQKVGLRGKIVEVVPDPHAIAGGSPIFAARVKFQPYMHPTTGECWPNEAGELLVSQTSIFLTFPIYSDTELEAMRANGQNPSGPVRFDGELRTGMTGRLEYITNGGPALLWRLVLDADRGGKR